jgi:hypothetical protein
VVGRVSDLRHIFGSFFVTLRSGAHDELSVTEVQGHYTNCSGGQELAMMQLPWGSRNTSMDNPLARVIALYLPQYYPTPEHDEWRGRGVTEWTSTAMAKPLFAGHYQPHVPGDLGFYDLRLPESRAAQAQLAREHGIEGFCYYHYWFAGRRILERPFDEVLASGQPDFPFCLNWAHQTWTGSQNGASGRVIIEQTYPGIDDHQRHFEALLPAFEDPRCLKVDGKPLFIVSHPLDLPRSRQVLDLWRELAVKASLPGLYIAGEQPDFDLRPLGYDAAVNVRAPVSRRDSRIPWTRPVEKLKVKYDEWRPGPIVHRYEDFIDLMLAAPVPDHASFPCVIPNWDSSPRSGANGLVLHGSTPELFRRHLRRALDSIADQPTDRRIVFVKSWNAWSDGNHLEPDLKFRRGYLQVLLEELTRQESKSVSNSRAVTVQDAGDLPVSRPVSKARVSSSTTRSESAEAFGRKHAAVGAALRKEKRNEARLAVGSLDLENHRQRPLGEDGTSELVR